MKRLVLFTLSVWALVGQAHSQNLSLAGRWRFQLDRDDVGVREQWFDRALPDSITLPGTLAEQGIGDAISTNTPWVGGILDRAWFNAPEYAKYREPGNMKVPFWLQPEKYYAGAAWFQRDIEIPTNWTGRRVVLFLERAHWETRLWVDSTLVGANNSLSTPHEYDLGQLAPGRHSMTVRVDNRPIIDIGENSHGISDHTQGNWNGIVGRIELRTTPPVWIENVQVYPDLARREVRVTGIARGQAAISGEMKLNLSLTKPEDGANVMMGGGELGRSVRFSRRGEKFEAALDLTEVLPHWDEFEPRLVKLSVLPVDAPAGGKEITFGIRNVATSRTQITINYRTTSIRGTLECAIFPKTGHPPMEVGEWRRIIRVAKAHGLNLMRFHSWCPPEAAFQAADELGMYFQVETCWPNMSTTIGDGKPVDQWVYDETDRILKYYGNHPSFLLMACGNEPGGRNDSAFMAKYVGCYKARDPRRLWTAGSGWPELPENQFHVLPAPRIQRWGAGLKSRINALPPETMTDYRDYISKRSVPVISHEIGQWCVYPNFDEIPKYTGYLKPRNFEIFRDRLEANGLGKLANQFLLASGKLQTLCYKEDIESALRTPGMGGFQLLDLHDFPGQGTALVGVLDPFWEEKGYVTAKDYRRFCSPTVPLARLKKRVFTTDETLEAEMEVAHFGPALPKRAGIVWHLLSQTGGMAASGRLPARDITVAGVIPLGKVCVELSNLPVPGSYKLSVKLGEASPLSPDGFRGNAVENDWDIWVYPAKPQAKPAENILVTSQLDDPAQQHLASGGKLLLTLPGDQVRNYDKDPVKLGFSSIFWNTAWTKRQAPTTLGILCDPKHPALAEFPTGFHSNWQWWYLVHRAGALRLDLLPREVEPIVRVIDDWFTARPLGLVIEAKVGQGSAVVCGFDLTRDSDDPVSRQIRASLLNYMAGHDFKPPVTVSIRQLRSLVVGPPVGNDFKPETESP